MEHSLVRNPDEMCSNEAATLLVKLYGEYINKCGGFGVIENDNYARAVGIAIRMLTE